MPAIAGGLRAARVGGGQAWACPLFLVPGAAVVSGVKGSPQGCRAPGGPLIEYTEF